VEAVMWSRKSMLRSKHLPRTLWHKCLETRGKGSLSECFRNPSHQDRCDCDVTVGSQTLKLESPEAAPAWPVAMAPQPAKQEEAEGRYPWSVLKSPQLSET
jgi:hypothetical protein